MEFAFRTAGKIVFGAGSLEKLGEEAASLGTSAFVVAGRSFLRQSGRLQEIEQLLDRAGLKASLHDGVPREPTLADAQQALDQARACGCDLVIGIGGGSAIDVAKTVASIAPAEGSVFDYFQGRRIERKGLAFIAAPTTAGSGSEVTPNSVLTDETRRVKASIRSGFMYADVALVDPVLTLTVPRDTTAYSGMDALSQAIEAYVSVGANPMTDALAANASVRLLLNLPGVYADLGNLALRTEVALGSLMGGIAFANARLGLVHGLAHPLGVRTGLPHGLVCALLLPEVMRFNLPTSGAKYAFLARSAGLAEGLAETEAADVLIQAVARLNADMGIEARRPGLAVSRSEWPGVVAEALASGSTKSNPREVTAGDIDKMLSALSS